MYNKTITDLVITQKNLMKIAVKTNEPLLIKDIEVIDKAIKALKDKRKEEFSIVLVSVITLIGLVLIANIIY